MSIDGWSRVTGDGHLAKASFGRVGTLKDTISSIRYLVDLYDKPSESGGTDPRARRRLNVWTQGHGFSDKYAVYGFDTDWVLKEIVDASDAGLLLGNGTKNGSIRAFILVPQAKVD